MSDGGFWDSTRVEPAGDRRYAATIGPEWQLAMVPQGGVLAAIAARAMEAELGTGQSLRSFHGVFVSPVPVGAVDIDVEVLRRGRSMSQVQATLRAPGAEAGFTALAAFGHSRSGFAYTDLTMPDVPPPEACVSFRDPLPPELAEYDHPPLRFWVDVLEGKPALGHPPWDPSPRGAAEAAGWYRFEQPPLDDRGEFDPLALLVAADMMPSAVFEPVNHAEQGWFAPSVDLTVHLTGACPRHAWILNHNRAHYAGDGYASAQSALWDPDGDAGPTLLAWATQIMFFTRVD